jgi:hypothetical protein
LGLFLAVAQAFLLLLARLLLLGVILVMMARVLQRHVPDLPVLVYLHGKTTLHILILQTGFNYGLYLLMVLIKLKLGALKEVMNITQVEGVLGQECEAILLLFLVKL